MLRGRINVDAVLYLEMAKRFAADNYQGALQLYNWPLFPWLMAMTHKMTGLSVQYAAHLLEASFFGITTWSFLTLAREGGGNRTTLVSAAILLFSAPYLVGDVLPMIMRDQGFWAFYLLSLLFFFRFYEKQKFTDALIWQIAAILAVLFRVEAVSFIILLPLCLLFRSDISVKSRLVLLFQSYSLSLAGVAATTIALAFLSTINLEQVLGRLTEVHTALLAAYHQLTSGLSSKAQVYGEAVLGKYIAEYAIYGLVLTLLVVIAGKIIGASSWLAVALASLAPATENQLPNVRLRTVLYWAAGINILNLIVILLTTFLLTGRYVAGLSFIILFFAAFKLAAMSGKWTKAQFMSLAVREKFICIVIVAFISYWLMANLMQRDRSNNYEQVAVSWVKQHVSPDASVFYDDARLRYYADAPWDGRETDWGRLLTALQNQVKPYDYLVLHIKRKQAEEKLALLSEMKQYHQIQEFKSGNGDRIWILAGHTE